MTEESAGVGLWLRRSVLIPSALSSHGVPDAGQQVKAKTDLDLSTTARQRKRTPGQTG